MTKDEARQVLEFCWDEGIEADEYGAYSGRGMYGRETQAVVIGDAFDKKVIERKVNREFSLDNLGLKYIIY